MNYNESNTCTYRKARTKTKWEITHVGEDVEKLEHSHTK